MKGSSVFPRSNRNKLLVPIGLSLLVSGRLLLQVMLYRSGFMSLTADEFGRTVLAAVWAQNPYTVWKGAWLPFHMYTFGAALRLKWDLIYVPRIAVILLGCTSILLTYLLTSRLMECRRIGLISAFLLAVNPVHIWLSSTPLTAMPYATCALAAVLSLVLYLKQNGQRYIYLGACMLALANGYRYEAWVLSAVFSLSLVGNGILLYKRKALDFRQSLNLILGAIIPWLFPIAWMVGNYVETGNPLFFLESVKSYKLTWYGQGQDYRNYWHTFLKIDPVATIFVALGLVICLLRHKKSWAVRWYVIIVVVPLVVFVYLHGGQIEPQGNYYRYLAFFVFITYPAIAYLIDFGADFVAKSRVVGWIRVALVLGLMGTNQTYRVFQFVNDRSADGLQVGQRIRELRSEHPELSQRPVVIELSYWQYLAIHVGANDVASIVYDRVLDFERRQSLSLLVTDEQAFRDCLSLYRVSYVIVKSPELCAIVESSLGVSPLEEINSYVFYPVPERLLEANTTTQRACPLILGHQ
jgi:hypothetical protein